MYLNAIIKYIICRFLILFFIALQVNGSGDEADAGVTYFVDEEGRYYYQPSGDNQNIVSLHGDEDNAEVCHFIN